MIRKIEKNQIRNRIHKRIRRKLSGTAERPRLAVYRSVAHIYAQVIDDTQGATLVAASSVGKTGGDKTGGDKTEADKTGVDKTGVDKTGAEKTGVDKAAKTNGGNVAAATAIGKLVAERAKEKGIKNVVFDRGGYRYHGRVKALADAAREAGLEF